MKKDDGRPRPLSIFLLKKEVKKPKACLDAKARVRELQIDPSTGVVGGCFVRDSKRRTPSWVSLLGEGVQGELANLRNQSNAAVLVIRRRNRLFAFAFGYGKSLLKPDCYERRFGLKVVLNSVEPSSIRSIDSKTFEALTIQTRRQASRATEVSAFGLDINRDLLRAVTGRPRDEKLASQLSGADALALTTRVDFKGLPSLCSRLLNAYESEEYKEHFPWVDHLEPIQDPGEVKKLNAVLVEALQAGNLEDAHLAPPEPIEWDRITGFRLPYMRSDDEPLPDMDLRSYLKLIPEGREITVEMLRRHKISAIGADSEDVLYQWSIFNSLVFEVERSPRNILATGQWSRVETKFVRSVRAGVSRIQKTKLRLPKAARGEYEPDYNRRVAGGRKDLALMDCVMVRVTGAGGIEACDLFSEKSHFIHVKHRSASSNLSHLWFQGANAAEVFLGDEGFRKDLMAKLAKHGAKFGNRIPEGPPSARKFEVVYAVISPKEKAVPHGLPFFSQLGLWDTAKRLRLLNFRVSVLHIVLD